MIRIDQSLVDTAFKAKYLRAAIIRFLMRGDDPKRPFRNKFGIVLNRNLEDSDAILAITTTNLERYASGYFENDIVRINAGTYGCFDEPTIVNLRELRLERIADLKSLYATGRMTFEGAIGDADMTEIFGKIQHSVLIEFNLKKRVL
jgi:hypothetical protein